MKINPNFSAFKISSKGMGIQKKQMELITENIANTSTTKTDEGGPYKRRFISVEFEKENLSKKTSFNNISVGFKSSRKDHFTPIEIENYKEDSNFKVDEKVDSSEGELVYMPDHPDADEEGYVQMPNVNIVTEMVDMINASRSFEANLTAFNAAKQMAKDSLEI